MKSPFSPLYIYLENEAFSSFKFVVGLTQQTWSKCSLSVTSGPAEKPPWPVLCVLWLLPSQTVCLISGHDKRSCSGGVIVWCIFFWILLMPCCGPHVISPHFNSVFKQKKCFHRQACVDGPMNRVFVSLDPLNPPWKLSGLKLSAALPLSFTRSVDTGSPTSLAHYRRLRVQFLNNNSLPQIL